MIVFNRASVVFRIAGSGPIAPAFEVAPGTVEQKGMFMPIFIIEVWQF
jgi:hypothetical protein